MGWHVGLPLLQDGATVFTDAGKSCHFASQFLKEESLTPAGESPIGALFMYARHAR